MQNGSLSEIDSQVDNAGKCPDDDNILLNNEGNELEQLTTDISNQEKETNLFRYILWTVYFLFWCTLYFIALELQFGIVFLMFSMLFGIYFNTRTGTKKENEVSAYSVFNRNCASIDGALKAEQFEKEMGYGSGSS